MINTLALRGRMAGKGYTQKSLAKELGMNKNTLGNKINGVSQFNVEEVNAVCEILGIESAEEKCCIFLHQPS